MAKTSPGKKQADAAEARDRRREFERRTVAYGINVVHGDETANGLVENVSPGGAFLRIDVAWPAGSRIEVVDPKTKMRLPAEVVRREDNGIGIAFSDDAAGSILAGWMQGDSFGAAKSSGSIEAPGGKATSDEALEAAIENYVWGAGEFGPLAHPAKGNSFMQELEKLYIDSEARVLFLDCGGGGLACSFAKKHDCKVFALDPNPQFVKAAKELAAQEGVEDRISIRGYLRGGLKLPKKGFDIIVARETESFCNPKSNDMIKEVSQALVTAGKLVIVDMFFVTEEHCERSSRTHWGPEGARLYKPGVYDKYEKLFSSAGFDIEKRADLTDHYTNAVRAAFFHAYQHLTEDMETVFSGLPRRRVLDCFLDRCTTWAWSVKMLENEGLEMRLLIGERQIKQLLSNW